MDYQVSARKYRPGTFDDVIGQSHRRPDVDERRSPPSGSPTRFVFRYAGGKTTVARILAKASIASRVQRSPCNTCVNCQEITQGTSVDVVEIDGASNTSGTMCGKFARTSNSRSSADSIGCTSSMKCTCSPTRRSTPVENAGRALRHVVFIFATTEIHKIPATILLTMPALQFPAHLQGRPNVQRCDMSLIKTDWWIEDRSLMVWAGERGQHA